MFEFVGFIFKLVTIGHTLGQQQIRTHHRVGFLPRPAVLAEDLVLHSKRLLEANKILADCCKTFQSDLPKIYIPPTAEQNACKFVDFELSGELEGKGTFSVDRELSGNCEGGTKLNQRLPISQLSVLITGCSLCLHL